MPYYASFKMVLKSEELWTLCGKLHHTVWLSHYSSTAHCVWTWLISQNSTHAWKWNLVCRWTSKISLL